METVEDPKPYSGPFLAYNQDTATILFAILFAHTLKTGLSRIIPL